MATTRGKAKAAKKRGLKSLAPRNVSAVKGGKKPVKLFNPQPEPPKH